MNTVMRVRRRSAQVACWSLWLLCGLSPALQAASSESDRAIEEIVVSAQRVEQNLQDVPIAVTAFGQDALRVNRMDAMIDIARRTPSFTATEVNPGEPNLAIRGIGTEGINSNAGGDPSVALFLDGVYIGRGGAAPIELYDLERVEVLRGPQGTLFGKNVVGGAVVLTSRRPSLDESFVEVDATFGNYDRIELLGSFHIQPSCGQQVAYILRAFVPKRLAREKQRVAFFCFEFFKEQEFLSLRFGLGSVQSLASIATRVFGKAFRIRTLHTVLKTPLAKFSQFPVANLKRNERI